MLPENARVLFTQEQVDAQIRRVAAAINQRYRARGVKLIGVLKGSVFFMTALARYLEIPVRFDFLAISSFSTRRGAPGVVRIEKDLDEPIEGEDVLVVEDIVDTGLTLRYLLRTLAGRGPNSLGICTLLDRAGRRLVEVPVEYRCFEIGDHFVVGCGLDYKQLYRNLDCVAVIENPGQQSGGIAVVARDPRGVLL